MKKQKAKLNEVTLRRLRAAYAEGPVRESDEVLFKIAVTEIPARAPVLPPLMDALAEFDDVLGEMAATDDPRRVFPVLGDSSLTRPRPPIALTLEREELAPFPLAALVAVDEELSSNWAPKRRGIEAGEARAVTLETASSPERSARPIEAASAPDRSDVLPTKAIEAPALRSAVVMVPAQDAAPSRRARSRKRGLLVAATAGVAAVAAGLLTVGLAASGHVQVPPTTIESRSEMPTLALSGLTLPGLSLPSLHVPGLELPVLPSLESVADSLAQAYQNGEAWAAELVNR